MSLSAIVSPVPSQSVKGRGKTHFTLDTSAGADTIHPMQIWRLPTVEKVVGHKKSFLYEKMALGEFPKPIPTGRRAKGWLAHEVIAWIESRAAMRS